MSQPARLEHAGEAAGFLEAFVGFVIALLVMLGFGGTVYKLIVPGGWIAQVFGRSLAGGMAVLLALLMIGASAWLLRAWISITQRNRYSELFVYVFAGVGLIYSSQILMKGGF
ncbi:MAG TPA: hypothetical protein VLV90_01015 [Burkholderiales bacterium]|nr:hypothetical protein [Burkholderiales bacterium]